MSIEHLAPHITEEVANLHTLYEHPTYLMAPDYSDPSSPDLDRLLGEANDNILIASRMLLDRMISGEIH